VADSTGGFTGSPVTDAVGETELNVAGPLPSPFHGFAASNSAVEFAGNGGDYIAVADTGTSALDFGNGDSITLEAWVKPDGASGLNYLIGKGRIGSSNLQNYGLRLRSVSATSAKLSFIYRNSANSAWSIHDTTDAVMPVDGKWHHVALTYSWDAGAGYPIAAYVDGQPKAITPYSSSTPPSPSPAVTNEDLWIGSSTAAASGSSLNGKIDEVAIYNRTLSGAEVKEHYDAAYASSATFGPFYEMAMDPNNGLGRDVISYWRLDETDAAQPAKDETGTHPGTYVGFEASDFGQPGGIRDDPTMAVNMQSENDSSLQYINAGDGVVEGLTELTAVMMVKMDDLSKDHTLLAKGQFMSGQPLLFWRDESDSSGQGKGNDTLACLISSRRAVADGGLFNDTDWHMVGFTFDGNAANGLQLYFDGRMVGATDTYGLYSIPTSSNPFTIGLPVLSTSSPQAFGGLMDDVVLFDRALTADEMRTLRNAAVPEPCTLSLLGASLLALRLRRRRR